MTIGTLQYNIFKFLTAYLSQVNRLKKFVLPEQIEKNKDLLFSQTMFKNETKGNVDLTPNLTNKL